MRHDRQHGFVFGTSLLVAALAFGVGGPALAGPADGNSEVTQRLNDATSVFQSVMATPDQAIPRGLLSDAHCLVIVPRTKKGALVVGATYGKGFITCRRDSDLGWTAPAAITMAGGSVGLQAGAEETDIVMLLMNAEAEDRLLSSQFTLGADASIAAGPVGRSTAAQTDAYLTAQLLSWSRSRGVFAGLSFQGATRKQDLETNRLLYGKELTNKQIVAEHTAAPPPAQQLIAVVGTYSPRAQHAAMGGR